MGAFLQRKTGKKMCVLRLADFFPFPRQPFGWIIFYEYDKVVQNLQQLSGHRISSLPSAKCIIISLLFNPFVLACFSGQALLESSVFNFALYGYAFFLCWAAVKPHICIHLFQDEAKKTLISSPCPLRFLFRWFPFLC
jgi:hypothetical protein